MSHRIAHPKHKKRDGAPISWPSFTGTAQLVGTSRSGVSVYVDASLGAQALQNATDLFGDADRIVGANNAFFGTLTGAVNVILFALGGATDGTGGADHMGCDFATGQNIEVCVSYGQSMRCSALFEAELSECSMNGQLCGLSTGEALSRWCAMDVSGNALADFASAPTWVQDGMVNWVDSTEPTDQDYDSIGCGMAFISWLISLGHPLTEIAPAMVKLGDGGTLALLYGVLTGDASTNAWPKFSAAIAKLGTLGVASDDPFGSIAPAPQPAPAPTPVPTPVPAPTGQSLITILGTIVSQVPQASK